MKTKKFRHDNKTYKSYFKKVGHGYEVGFTCGTKKLFVGNFINSKDANGWWSLMNKEITKFGKKYWATKETSSTFYQKFISHNLFKNYYSYTNKCVARYNREAERAFKQDERKYKQLKRNWTTNEKLTWKKAA
jgi:hypothetical protein